MSKSGLRYMQITEDDMGNPSVTILKDGQDLLDMVKDVVEPVIEISITGPAAIAIQDMLNERGAQLYLANKLKLSPDDIEVNYENQME